MSGLAFAGVADRGAPSSGRLRVRAPEAAEAWAGAGPADTGVPGYVCRALSRVLR
ncbi:hypothetical protein OG741_34620 [Streptomyces sp. NBC_01410]|uniref:hypothetical protein n=1 Tax=Streptomyces sp. NBC_01410 TaxID=2903856 RepID=UPI0032516FB5